MKRTTTRYRPTEVVTLPTLYQSISLQVTHRSTLGRGLGFSSGCAGSTEPEGYSLPSGPYLPDFLLPDLHDGRGAWLEVKAGLPEGRRGPSQGRTSWPGSWLKSPTDGPSSPRGLPDPEGRSSGLYSHGRMSLCPNSGYASEAIYGLSLDGDGKVTIADADDSDPRVPRRVSQGLVAQVRPMTTREPLGCEAKGCPRGATRMHGVHLYCYRHYRESQMLERHRGTAVLASGEPEPTHAPPDLWHEVPPPVEVPCDRCGETAYRVQFWPGVLAFLRQHEAARVLFACKRCDAGGEEFRLCHMTGRDNRRAFRRRQGAKAALVALTQRLRDMGLEVPRVRR